MLTKEEKIKVVITSIIAFVVSGVVVLACWGIPYLCIETEYNTTHQVGVYACPKCNSKETLGHSTYWTNDGMLVKHKDLADYTLFRCNYCSYCWKVPV